MKIAITGALGFVGRSLTEFLTSKGFEVIALGRGSSHSIFAQYNPQTNEILKEELPLETHFKGVDAVIHLAAKQVESMNAPLSDYIASNIELTEQVCRSTDPSAIKRIVFASSRLVYPGTLTYDAEESFTGAPDNTYGLSKRMGEDIIQFYSGQKKFSAISLRFGQIFGKHSSQRGAIGRFIQQAEQKGCISVFGQGIAVRDFIYIKDVLSAFEAALSDNAPSGIYNIGSGCGQTIHDLASTICETVLGRPDRVKMIAVENEDQSRYVMDCSKARKSLNWEPRWSLKRALDDFYRKGSEPS